MLCRKFKGEEYKYLAWDVGFWLFVLFFKIHKYFYLLALLFCFYRSLKLGKNWYRKFVDRDQFLQFVSNALFWKLFSSLCNSASVSIITGHQHFNYSSDPVKAKWFLSKCSVIFSNFFLCRRLVMLALKCIHVWLLQKGLKLYMLLSQNWHWLIQALYYLKGDGNLGLKNRNNKQT